MLAGSADEQGLEPGLAGPPRTGWTVGGRQLKAAASQWTWAQENMHFNSWNLCNILKPFSLSAICVALCLCLHGGDLFRKGKKTDIWPGHLATPRWDSGNKVSYLSPRALTPKSVWCGPIWVGGHCRGVGVTPEAKGRSWLLSRRRVQEVAWGFLLHGSGQTQQRQERSVSSRNRSAPGPVASIQASEDRQGVWGGKRSTISLVSGRKMILFHCCLKEWCSKLWVMIH